MTFLHTSTAPRPLSIGGRAGVVAAGDDDDAGRVRI